MSGVATAVAPLRSQPLDQSQLAKLFMAHLKPQKSTPEPEVLFHVPQYSTDSQEEQSSSGGSPRDQLAQPSASTPETDILPSNGDVEMGDDSKDKAEIPTVCHMTPTPLKDGLKWRKYGQKAVKNSPFPRTYHKCTTAGCPAKKQIEKYLDNGTEMFKTLYVGQHIHGNPVFSQVFAETQEAFQNLLANYGSVSNSEGSILEIECAVGVNCSLDGHVWRKYGQKKVKTGPHQRAYYKCAAADCEVKKTLEQTSKGTFLVNYNGTHNHSARDYEQGEESEDEAEAKRPKKKQKLSKSGSSGNLSPRETKATKQKQQQAVAPVPQPQQQLVPQQPQQRQTRNQQQQFQNVVSVQQTQIIQQTQIVPQQQREDLVGRTLFVKQELQPQQQQLHIGGSHFHPLLHQQHEPNHQHMQVDQMCMSHHQSMMHSHNMLSHSSNRGQLMMQQHQPQQQTIGGYAHNNFFVM